MDLCDDECISIPVLVYELDSDTLDNVIMDVSMHALNLFDIFCLCMYDIYYIYICEYCVFSLRILYAF